MKCIEFLLLTGARLMQEGECAWSLPGEVTRRRGGGGGSGTPCHLSGDLCPLSLSRSFFFIFWIISGLALLRRSGLFALILARFLRLKSKLRGVMGECSRCSSFPNIRRNSALGSERRECGDLASNSKMKYFHLSFGVIGETWSVRDIEGASGSDHTLTGHSLSPPSFLSRTGETLDG